jgi:hypothetical protein
MFYGMFTDTTTASVSKAAPTTETLTTGSRILSFTALTSELSSLSSATSLDASGSGISAEVTIDVKVVLSEKSISMHLTFIVF